MAEEAAPLLDPSDGSLAMSAFDQLRKHVHVPIRSEKNGNKYIFVYLPVDMLRFFSIFALPIRKSISS